MNQRTANLLTCTALSLHGAAGPTREINTGGIVDTADLGLLNAEFGGFCS